MDVDWVELYRIIHRPIKGAKVPSCVTTTVNVAAAPTCPGLKSSQAVIMVILVSIALVDWYSHLLQVPSRSQLVGTLELVTLC